MKGLGLRLVGCPPSSSQCWDSGLLWTGWDSEKGAQPSGLHSDTLGRRPGLQACLFSAPQGTGLSQSPHGA